MRNMLVLLVLAITVAYAFDIDGCNDMSDAASPPVSSTDADITLSIENTWEITWCTQALGMDAWVSGSTINIIFSSNTDMQINSLDPATGTSAGAYDLIPENGACFGVVWNDDLLNPVWHTDDWFDTVLYYTEDNFSTWQTVSNPASYDGRGMDHEGSYYWIAKDDIGVYRFIPGAETWFYTMPQVTSQMSGLTAFEYMGDICIVVTSYLTAEWYFYLWEGGTSLTYLGSTPAPVTSIFRSTGLTHCYCNDHIYWGYATTPTSYSISEVSFSITMTLEQGTWAGIKAGF